MIKTREPYCEHGPFDACRCIFSEPDTSKLSVTPGITPEHQAFARAVTFKEPPPLPAWADVRDEHSEEL